MWLHVIYTQGVILFLFAALIPTSNLNLIRIYENDNIQKLKASSFRLSKNYFYRWNIVRARAFQSSITFFWDTLYINDSLIVCLMALQRINILYL